MGRNGKRCRVSGFGENDVAAALAGHLPNPACGRLLRRPEVEAPERAASDENFHFAGGDRQWHVRVSTDGKAFLDRLAYVGLRFLFAAALTHASRDGRAFGDRDPIFILLNGNHQLHFSSQRHYITLRLQTRPDVIKR